MEADHAAKLQKLHDCDPNIVTQMQNLLLNSKNDAYFQPKPDQPEIGPDFLASSQDLSKMRSDQVIRHRNLLLKSLLKINDRKKVRKSH